MSSKVTFQPCEFRDVRIGDKHFGCRIFDNYGSTYTNTWDSIPDDDLDVVQKCIEDFDGVDDSHPFVGMVNHVIENKCGVCVGDEWYGFDKIKHLFDNNL